MVCWLTPNHWNAKALFQPKPTLSFALGPLSPIFDTCPAHLVRCPGLVLINYFNAELVEDRSIAAKHKVIDKNSLRFLESVPNPSNSERIVSTGGTEELEESTVVEITLTCYLVFFLGLSPQRT
ncbi:unnamed protein product [Clavelina lepadiformis]|uniref:Uncharacterized protein n=1 Tax=Clavelina lepadiformis TaxID=159417 RepID=A0ABP0G068_CLALP